MEELTKNNIWSGRFEFDAELPPERVYKDSDGALHITAVASDTLIDRQDDRMSLKALRKMEFQLKREKIPLLDSHSSTFGFGRSHSAKITKVGTNTWELEIDFELKDNYPQSLDLFNSIQSGKSAFQLSIGGFVNKNNPDAIVFERDKETGRPFRTINDVVLDHVASTRPKAAANPRTKFLSAIIKSMDGVESDTEFTKWHFKDGIEEHKSVVPPPDDSISENDSLNSSENTMQKNLDGSEVKVEETVAKEESVRDKLLKTINSATEAIKKGFTPDQLEEGDDIGNSMKAMKGALDELFGSDPKEEASAEEVVKTATPSFDQKKLVDDIVSEVVLKVSEVNGSSLSVLTENLVTTSKVEEISKALEEIKEALEKSDLEVKDGIDKVNERIAVIEKAGGRSNSLPVQGKKTEPEEKENIWKNTFSASANRALAKR